MGEGMTLQEMFDVIYKGLASQGFAQSRLHGCAYRGGEGRKCAAGWLIPDDKYDESWEGKGIHRIPYFFDLCGRSIELLCDLGALQSIHDTSHDPEVMQKRLIEYARGMYLTIPEVV